MNVDRLLEGIRERLRRYCGQASEQEIEQLATDLFLESVRFGLSWVEDWRLAPTRYHQSSAYPQ